jgi:transcriptional regulator with XRE-family HTH domain
MNERKAKLKALFLERGLRATKVAEKLNINRATVYAACNPLSDRYVSEKTLNRIEAYLTNPVL